MGDLRHIVLSVGCLECGGGDSSTELIGVFATPEEAETVKAGIWHDNQEDIVVLAIPESMSPEPWLTERAEWEAKAREARARR